MSLSDKMLAGGCALHIETVHGEPILILSGPDAGGTFIAVRETETDQMPTIDFWPDPRPKRSLRFRDGVPVPRLTAQSRVKTEDGKIWQAIRRPDAGYLSTDFELIEVVPGKDL